MAGAIRLLATDLDGTVAASQNSAESVAEFAAVLQSLRSQNGTCWAVFSGRRRRHVLQLLTPLRSVGAAPDFVVLGNATICRSSSIGYLPCVRWNAWMLWRLLRDPARASRIVDDWFEHLVSRQPMMRTLIRTEHRLRMRFESEQTAAEVAASLAVHIQTYRHLRVICSGVEVEVMPVPYIKGLAMTEISRRLGVERDEVLAVGNGRTDLSLVDPCFAGMCGCPANSDSRLIQAVHEAGGHVSRQRSLAGVLDVIQAHRTGAVQSELPPDWKVFRRELSMPERPWVTPRQRRNTLRIAAAMVVLYMVLVVFASFEILPFSGWILKPYEKAISLLSRAWK